MTITEAKAIVRGPRATTRGKAWKAAAEVVQRREGEK
jgi:hypothetical protein